MILSLFLGGRAAAAVSVVGSDDSCRQQSNLKRECRALFAVVVACGKKNIGVMFRDGRQWKFQLVCNVEGVSRS